MSLVWERITSEGETVYWRARLGRGSWLAVKRADCAYMWWRYVDAAIISECPTHNAEVANG